MKSIQVHNDTHKRLKELAKSNKTSIKNYLDTIVPNIDVGVTYLIAVDEGIYIGSTSIKLENRIYMHTRESCESQKTQIFKKFTPEELLKKTEVIYKGFGFRDLEGFLISKFNTNLNSIQPSFDNNRAEKVFSEIESKELMSKLSSKLGE